MINHIIWASIIRKSSIASLLLSLRQNHKRIQRNTREHGNTRKQREIQENTGEYRVIYRGMQKNTEEYIGKYKRKYKEECREAQGI